MKEKTCCFTGHRKIPQNQVAEVTAILERTVIDSINRGYRFFGAGGALGFDTMAAQTVLKLKDIYPQIRLILVLPCINQTRGWAVSDIEKYENIKISADKIVYISKEYTNICMMERNRHLVNNSSLCICYLTARSGGTAYTVDYAKKQHLTILNIAEMQRQP